MNAKQLHNYVIINHIVLQDIGVSILKQFKHYWYMNLLAT